jgi:hypothetical protein
MAYSTVDTDGGTATGVETLTPTVGDAVAGDDAFLHVVWTDPTITLGDVGDWTIVDEAVTGPEYLSALYHLTLAGGDDLQLDWTGACDLTWQVLACGGLALDPVDSSATEQTNSSAILQRLLDLPDSVHVACFAGAVNTLSKDNTSVRPDVGFITSEATETDSGVPTLWTGQFGGPVGDLDTTFPAAVYFDPPPTHSVGYSVAVEVSNVTATLLAEEGSDTATVDLTITLAGNFAATGEPVNIDWGDTNDDDETIDAGEDTFDHEYQVFEGPYDITVTTRSGATATAEFDPVDPN